MMLRRFLAALIAVALLGAGQAYALSPVQKRAIYQTVPGWVPKGASFAFDGAKACGVYSKPKVYYGVAMTAQFSTWSTPGHYATTKAGTLVAIPANTPDCVAGGDQGQLIEEARTNYAYPFNGSGSNIGAGFTRTNNYAAAPDGTTTAQRLQWSGSVNSFQDFPAITEANGTYTVSRFFKDLGSGSKIAVIAKRTNTAWFAQAEYDFGAATATATYGVGSSGVTLTSVSASSETFANGWVRVAITFTLGSADGSKTIVCGDNIRTNVAGDALAWGIQFEIGSFATSVIATTSGTVPRAATSIVANDGSAVATAAQNAKALFAKTQKGKGGSTPFVTGYAGGASLKYASTTTLALTNGTNTATATIGGSGTYSGIVNMAAGMDASSFTLRANGGTSATSANAWAGNTGALYLGTDASGLNSLNGYLATLAFANTKGIFDSLAVAP